jgi:hypothetical protein
MLRSGELPSLQKKYRIHVEEIRRNYPEIETLPGGVEKTET